LAGHYSPFVLRVIPYIVAVIWFLMVAVIK